MQLNQPDNLRPHWPPPLHLLQQQQNQHLPQQQAQHQQQRRPAAPNRQQQLGSDQQRALDAVLDGQCVFLTGGAGVGKSFTVASIVKALQCSNRQVAVTASTGTAAVNVNGCTLHSFAGILDPKKHPGLVAENLWQWAKFRESWRGTDTLLMDEISMIDCQLLEKIDYIARYLRGWRIPEPLLPGLLEDEEVHELHPDPFGGLQVITVGDFFQLSPVPEKRDEHEHSTPPRSGHGQGRGTAASGSDRGSGSCSNGYARGYASGGAGSGGSYVYDDGGLGATHWNSITGSSPYKSSGCGPVAYDDGGDGDGEAVEGNVRVIIAVVPAGFVSKTAADRTQWSKMARSAAAAAAACAAGQPVGTAGAAGSNGTAAAAAAVAASYPTVGVLAGGFIDKQQLPAQQQVAQPQQQQQQQRSHNASVKRSVDSPQHQHGVGSDTDASLMQRSPAKRIKLEPVVAVDAPALLSETTTGAIDDRQQTSQCKLPQAAAPTATAAKHSTCQLQVSSYITEDQQKLQLLQQRMTKQISSKQSQALGIKPAKSKQQLRQAAQQLLMQRSDLLNRQKCTKAVSSWDQQLGMQLLLQNVQPIFVASAAADPAAAGGNQAAAEAVTQAAASPSASFRFRSAGNIASGAVTAAAAVPVIVPEYDSDSDDEYEAASLAISQAEQAAAAAAAAVAAVQRIAGAPQTAQTWAGSISDLSQDTAADSSPAAGVSTAVADSAALTPSSCLQRLSLTDRHATGTADAKVCRAAGAAQAFALDGEDTSAGQAVCADAAECEKMLRDAVIAEGTACVAWTDSVELAVQSDTDHILPTQVLMVDAQTDVAVARADGTVAADVASEDDAWLDGAELIIPTQAVADTEQQLDAAAAAADTSSGDVLANSACIGVTPRSDCEIVDVIVPQPQAQMQQQQHQLNQQACEIDVIDLCDSQNQLSSAAVVKGETVQVVGLEQEHSPLQAVKQERQQQQQWYRLPVPPSPVQLLAAAAAAAGESETDRPAGRLNPIGNPPGSICVPDGPYTLSGQYGFKLVHDGRVYDDCSAVPVSASGGSSSMGPWSKAGVRQGSTNDGSSSAAAAAGAGSSSSSARPVMPQWCEPKNKNSYCFKSPAWAAAGFNPVVLKQPFRQNEPELLTMLNEVRHGIFTDQTRSLLRSLERALPLDDGIEPTEIYPRNKQVDKLNEKKYAMLSGPELITRSIDRIDIPGSLAPDVITEYLDNKVNAQGRLELKPQAQVVLLWNLNVPAGLANGTRGVVEGFASTRDYLTQEGLLPQLQGGHDGRYQSSNWQPNSRERPHYPQPWGQQQDEGVQHGQPPGYSCQQQQPGQQPGQQAAQSPQPRQQLPRYSELQPEPGCCGDPLCPCGMSSWAARQTSDVRIRLPDAADGLTITLPDHMPPWRRKQMQDSIVWINHTGTTQLPMVRFALPPHQANNPFAVPLVKIVGPQVWTQERPVRVWDPVLRKRVLTKAKLTRTALPLRLAWALTVHEARA